MATTDRANTALEQRVIELATAYAHANGLRGHRLEPAGIGLFLAGMLTGSALSPECAAAIRQGYTAQLGEDPAATLERWAAWLDEAARG